MKLHLRYGEGHFTPIENTVGFSEGDIICTDIGVTKLDRLDNASISAVSYPATVLWTFVPETEELPDESRQMRDELWQYYLKCL
jgi:hypothetical protein